MHVKSKVFTDFRSQERLAKSNTGAVLNGDIRGTAPQTDFVIFWAFSQKLQHIGDSKICFLQATLLHRNFTNSSGYWFIGQNMQNIDFHTLFTVTSQQWLYWSNTVIFYFPGTYTIRSILNFVQSCFIFLKKYKKSSKIRSKGAIPPQPYV